MPVGNAVPMPFPPADASVPIYQIADGQFLVDETGGQVAASPHRLGVSPPVPGGSVAVAVSNQATALVNLIGQLQAKAASQQSRMLMRSFGLDVPTPGGGEGGDGSGGDYPTTSSTYTIDTNQLWLQITNVANGLASLNLYNATNQVYAIWCTTNLLGDWQVQTDLWPTLNQTNVFPFTLPTAGQPTLFVRAEDWTGVDSDGDGVPDWWAWDYWGTNNVPDTNLDYSGNGNTFAQDYSNTVPPTVFSFTGIEVANNYVNTLDAAAQLDVSGTPYFIAMAVDDTNYSSDAIWNTYNSSNVTVNLGMTEGWHDVWIGLRGHGDAPATAVWWYKRLKLDFTPPVLSITSPTNTTLDEPMIQLTGFSAKPLASISYDLTNAAGLVTNRQAFVLDQVYSTKTWEFTTNTFQAFDVPLTNGINTITLHAVDLAGNVTTLSTNLTVDYSAKTAPVVQIEWPKNGAELTGGSFICRGWVSDATATVTASCVITNADTNIYAGGIYTNVYSTSVGRNGKFWFYGLPLMAGSNTLTIAAQDVAGNVTATNLCVSQSSLIMTIDPVTPATQLWKATVNVTGEISDPTMAIWVNGVKGHNNGDGTWSASGVPVTPGGTANFDMTGYTPDERQPDGSYGN